jgi:quercetin dioxygenase-like cupin family protein
MEIRRFGTGHRRPDGPPGTRGVEAQPIHGDDRGTIAELALRPNAAISPHSNPNLAYLLVIEGGGWVAVGQERARVSAGDAVVWPPDVIHAAWTESTPMRAIVVEFVAAADEPPALLLDGLAGSEAPHAAALPGVGAALDGRLAPADGRVAPADGGLAPNPPSDPPPDRSSPDGEPW